VFVEVEQLVLAGVVRVPKEIWDVKFGRRCFKDVIQFALSELYH